VVSVTNLVPPFTVRAREGVLETLRMFNSLEHARVAAAMELEDYESWGKDVVITITSREYMKPQNGDGMVRDEAPFAIYRR
jgi:hypothetical protein